MSDVSFITASTAQSATYPVDATIDLSPSYPQLSSSGVAGQNVDAVSQDFEAVFITQMLSEMFAGDSTSSYFGGGTEGDVYKSFLLNEYGKLIAKAGGIGIAQQVKQELLKLQEIKQ